MTALPSGGVPGTHAAREAGPAAAPERLPGTPSDSRAVTAAQVADVLDQARRMIEERGHWDGTVPKSLGECPMTALTKCDVSIRVMFKAMDAIEREAGVDSIPRWNDSSDAEAVLLTLKRAAERVRTGGLP